MQDDNLPSPVPKSKALDVPPLLISEIALGMENPVFIAARHGFSEAEYNELAAYPVFKLAVEHQKALYEREGVTYQNKAAVQAQYLADKVFTDAMRPDTPIPQALAAAEFFRKAGALEAKAKASETAAGPGFSVVINIGEVTKQVTVRPATLGTDQAQPETMVLDMEAPNSQGNPNE